MIGVIEFGVKEVYAYIPRQTVKVGCVSIVILQRCVFYRLAITENLIKTEDDDDGARSELREVEAYSLKNAKISVKMWNINSGETQRIGCDLQWVKLDGHIVCGELSSWWDPIG